MNTVGQMAAHHLQPAPARLRKLFKSFRGRPDPMGIHREDRKRAVLPLDNPVKGRPRGFGDVKENQRLAIHRSRTLTACVRWINCCISTPLRYEERVTFLQVSRKADAVSARRGQRWRDPPTPNP